MKKDTDQTYTLALRVRNRPGVLVRCAQVYGRRGHNIESLHVSPMQHVGMSTMQITAFGQPHLMDQIIAQLRKVHDVQDVTVKETTK